jgi:RyR domain
MARSAMPAYQPRPIPLDGVEVEDDLAQLVELLARNAHDVWAFQRLADGWTFGNERCDSRRTHPCLVEYDELPESEKAYDRNLALSTIRAIIALGYTVSKNG